MSATAGRGSMLGVVFVAWMTGGCSLIVSFSGLDDGTPAPGADAADLNEAGVAGDDADSGTTPCAASAACDLVTSIPGVTGLFSDGTSLYFVVPTTASLWKVNKAGGAPVRVDAPSDGVSDPFDIAVTSTTLYWTERAAARIASRPLAGGTRQDLPAVAGITSLAYLATDGTAVFASDDNPGQLTAGNIVQATATDAGVWTALPNIVSGLDVELGTLVVAQATYGAVLWSPIAPVSITYVGQTKPQATIGGVAYDGTYVYFVESGTTLVRMAVADGTLSTVAGLAANIGQGDVAVDPGYVYVSEPALGKIQRFPNTP